MNKTFISILTSIAIVFSHGIQADVNEIPEAQESPVTDTNVPLPPPADNATDVPPLENTPLPYEKEVSPAPEEERSAQRRQNWINIGLAAGAIIIATVALILVGKHNGHRKKG